MYFEAVGQDVDHLIGAVTRLCPFLTRIWHCLQDLDRHIGAVTAELSARARFLVCRIARLREEAGIAAVCRRPAGGYFLWLEFLGDDGASPAGVEGASPAGFDTLALWTMAQVPVAASHAD